MPILNHGDRENLHAQLKGTFDKAADLGLLTDSIVNLSTTREQLKTRMGAVAVHADLENFKTKLYNAVNVAGWSDADIAGVTTIAGLQALIPGSLTQQSVLD